MIIKQLIAEDFTVTKKDLKNPDLDLKVGDKYSYFKDPETGKYYRPVEGFTVIAKSGGDLSDRFVEV